jgi:5-carboxymethyl-2-hydroxymuconate isomerase
VPHLTIEHSSQTQKIIDIKKVTSIAHKALCEVEGINIKGIRTRSIGSQNLLFGDEQNYDTLIAITVLLLNEDRDTYKQNIADSLFKKVKSFVNDPKINITVNVTNLGAYAK